MGNKETYIIEQKLTADNSSLVSGNKEAKSSANELSGAVNGVKTKLKNLVSPMNLAAGAAAYLSYRTVQAVKDFAAFEKQLSSVNTLLKVSKSELNAYGDGLVDISIKTGAAKETLADGAYQALSSGIEASDLLEFMETAAQGATVGMTDVSTATDVLTSTLNGFKLESSDATDTMDKLITIQNNGKVVLGQLSTVMGDVADISSNLGLDLDNVGAAISTITMSGTPAAQAGTRLKAMFSELSKEGTTAYDIFQMITGESFKDFISEGGNLGEALQEIEEYAESSGKEMIDLWSSIEAGQGAMGITGSNASAFSSNLDKMKKSTGELEKAYAIASDNIATDWTKLTAKIDSNWKDLIIELQTPIRAVIEVAYKMVDFAGNVDFIENTKKIYNALGGNIVNAVSSGITRVITDFQNENSMRNQETPNYFKNEKSEIQFEKSSQRTYFTELEAKEEAVAQAALLKQQKEGDEAQKKAAEKAVKDKQALLVKIAAYEAEHADKINLIDIGVLTSKKEYQEDLYGQLEAGLISREDYENQLTAFEEKSELEQNERYINALEELKSFYEKYEELAKANEIEKQILEIEIQITGMEGDMLYGGLTDFQEAQTKAAELYHNTLLAGEYDFQQEKLDLFSSGAITEQEYTQSLFDYRQNINTLENEFKIQQLEELRAYQSEKLGDLAAAAETQREIEEAKVENTNQVHDLEIQNEENYNNTISDLKQGVVKVFAETASDILRGEIDSLNELANMLLERLGTLALGEAEQALVRSYVDYAKGVSYAADPLTAALAPPLFSAASNELALAGQLGAIGAVSMAASSAFSSDDGGSSSSYDYGDDEDVSTTESTASESDSDSTTIYVSTDDNSMAKAMVRILEDELNDEYNVSIIGNKK
ncbi:phage tail tape measure protein [uncultured Ilyobacter sp.]|uniref:phage tail tape measure protein n=1 Tax=uncultured Ilyobacter sp. TaxID=544433 RepID=UPI002AA838BB|nr:phage tail tape measure protein [uncultured Ilyobacter sp.]